MKKKSVHSLSLMDRIGIFGYKVMVVFHPHLWDKRPDNLKSNRELERLVYKHYLRPDVETSVHLSNSYGSDDKVYLGSKQNVWICLPESKTKYPIVVKVGSMGSHGSYADEPFRDWVHSRWFKLAILKKCLIAVDKHDQEKLIEIQDRVSDALMEDSGL